MVFDFECNSCGTCLLFKMKKNEYKIRNNQLCCVECATPKYRNDEDTEFHTKLMLGNLGIEKTLKEIMTDFYMDIHDPRITAYIRDVLNVDSKNPYCMGRIYYGQ